MRWGGIGNDWKQAIIISKENRGCPSAGGQRSATFATFALKAKKYHVEKIRNTKHYNEHGQMSSRCLSIVDDGTGGGCWACAACFVFWKLEQQQRRWKYVFEYLAWFSFGRLFPPKIYIHISFRWAELLTHIRPSTHIIEFDAQSTTYTHKPTHIYG